MTRPPSRLPADGLRAGGGAACYDLEVRCTRLEATPVALLTQAAVHRTPVQTSGFYLPLM